jgi:hypothetical protein
LGEERREGGEEEEGRVGKKHWIVNIRGILRGRR